jgi:Tfp pilus assembly protein PilE
VVVILAALAAIAIPRLSQCTTSAKVNACKENLAILNTAIERHYLNNGFLPCYAS